MNRLAPLLAAIALCTSLSAQRPNVLLIIADDLGVDYVSSYGIGSDPAPMPIVDGLAQNGLLFRNAWACPTCSPTRAMINSGRYGVRTGIGNPGGSLDLDEETIPEFLDSRNSGYAHAWIGKWHLAGRNGDAHPNDSGWSHFAGILGGGVGNYFRWDRTVNGVTNRSTTYTTTQIVDDALSWIGQQNQPWLCTVAFNAPHSPWGAPPANLHTQNLAGLDPNTNPQPFYKAMVEAMDTEIGRLLNGLGTSLQNTNVIFIGDNGTPGRMAVAPINRRHLKGSPYETGVGVPFIIAGPSVTAPGRTVDHLVSAVDLMATIGDITGVSAERPWIRSDTVSFAPYLASASAPAARTYIYSESFDGDPRNDGDVMVRNARYKLIQRLTATSVTEEFYDLQVDPLETANLVPRGLNAQQQAARDELAAHIEDVRDEGARFESFGISSCAGANGIPRLMGLGTPDLGGSYMLAVADAAANTPILISLGASTSTFSGIPLPFALDAIGGGAGCYLEASLELTASTVADGAGSASLALNVPALPPLLGGAIHHQALILDGTAPAGLVSTRGVTAVVGR